jgi:hypothetical protein
MRKFLDTKEQHYSFFTSKKLIIRIIIKLLREIYYFLCHSQATNLQKKFEKFIFIISRMFDENYQNIQNAQKSNFSLSSLDYYIQFGLREGKNPNNWFDIKSYLETYSDVKDFGMNPIVNFYLTELDRNRVF